MLSDKQRKPKMNKLIKLKKKMNNDQKTEYKRHNEKLIINELKNSPKTKEQTYFIESVINSKKINKDMQRLVNAPDLNFYWEKDQDIAERVIKGFPINSISNKGYLLCYNNESL